jgi:hypothetical protein
VADGRKKRRMDDADALERIHSVIGDLPTYGYLRGYVAQVQLQEEEIYIMFDLFLTRMFVRIVITEWRARQFPGNREYILRNTATSWSQLEQLLSLPFDETRSLIESACKE